MEQISTAEVKQEVRKRKAKKLPVALTQEEFNSLIKVTKKKHHKLAYVLGFASGLRISEITKLEPRDIDLNGRKIFIRLGKGSKDRVVPLPKGFQESYLKVLPIKCGERALEKAFKRHCNDARLLETKPSLHFHSLRHGFATHFLEQGGDIQFLKVLMGHTNIATTDIYNQLNPQKALKAYEELF